MCESVQQTYLRSLQWALLGAFYSSILMKTLTLVLDGTHVFRMSTFDDKVQELVDGSELAGLVLLAKDNEGWCAHRTYPRHPVD